ncbi:MAG: hypothetical protein J5I91_02980 [Bacteroidetes bacterium]|nr:hypothetical protein [Bacteroidota bacterium]
MKTGFLHLHNLTAWLLLAILIVMVVLFFINNSSRKPLSKLQNNLRLFAVIISGLQLIVGFGIYFMNGWFAAFSQMSDSLARFYALEHPLMMTLGILFIHIGSAKIKRASEEKKNKVGLIFFGISLVLILSRVPWDRII